MLKNLKNKKKGFTLIELIIVIAIIAILAAIALPKFGDVRKKANISADIANAKQIQSAISVVIADGKADLPSSDTSFSFDNAADAADASVSTIESEAVKQLQGSIPKLKAENKGGYFYVTVTKDGEVSIKSASNGVQIYPNGASPYNE